MEFLIVTSCNGREFWRDIRLNNQAFFFKLLPLELGIPEILEDLEVFHERGSSALRDPGGDNCSGVNHRSLLAHGQTANYRKRHANHFAEQSFQPHNLSNGMYTL